MIPHNSARNSGSCSVEVTTGHSGAPRSDAAARYLGSALHLRLYDPVPTQPDGHGLVVNAIGGDWTEQSRMLR